MELISVPVDPTQDVRTRRFLQQIADVINALIRNSELVRNDVADWSVSMPAGSFVSSFNTRTGDVTLTSLDVTAALGFSPQPLDGDLTALAALTGTNTIYYRSGASTWTGVTIGSGISFAGGTLTATGSGGSVTSVDITPPAAGITASGGPITTSGNITLALADDLAALEALSGTNTIYYRSAASTWTAVAIGSGLSFSGGSLSATGTGGTVTSIDVSGGTTGLTFSGGPITTSGTITMAGTLAVDNGGTGATTASGARTNLGLVIGSDVQAASSVLSALASGATPANRSLIVGDGFGFGMVAMTASTFLICTAGGVVSPSAITSFGITFAASADASAARSNLGLVIGTDVQAHDADLDTLAGLTATTDNFIVSVSSAWASRTPAQVRTTLGLVIGTNVQAWDADLDVLAGITIAANTFPARSSAGAAAAKTITDFGLSLVDDADAAAARTTLGLVIGTNVQAADATLTAFAALTIAANSLTIGTGADAFSQTTFAANTFPARASTGNLVAKTITDFGLSLVDDTDAAAGRTTLGLGTSATVDTGTSGTKVALTDGANQWSSTQRFINSSGITILDTDASHTLGIIGGSNLTANRTLTITTGDASRTLTFTADATIGGTNSGDQTITLTGDVTGSGTGSFAATVVAASDTAAGKIEIAVQSEMETGTDVVRAVVPGRQQFHPSAAKAFVYFTVSGTTVTVERSYNVTSVTRNSVGNYTVTFTTAFSDAKYTVSVNLGVNVANTHPMYARDTGTRAVGSFQFTCVQLDAVSTLDDPARASLVFFGDQ